MEVTNNLFKPESVEHLEAELVALSETVMNTDDIGALQNLFLLVEGYAMHLHIGLHGAGFDEDTAARAAWLQSWKKLRVILDRTDRYTSELAAYFERNLAILYPSQVVNDVGEPLDPMTRAFYKTYIDCIEAPAVSKRAPWLSED